KKRGVNQPLDQQITITFPDGAEKEFPQGTIGEDIAQSISPGLRKQALAVTLDQVFYDLRTPLPHGGEIAIITAKQADGLDIMRRSTAHVMAQAVKRLFGSDVKLAIGPIIEDGFYYDFDLEHALTPEDLPKIEKEMQRIVDENLEIRRVEVSREEARARYQEINDPLKLELLDDIPEDEKVTVYEQGEFFDLCRGVHVTSTSKIKVFKLLNIS